jgi:hypothetical protein
MDNQKKHGKKSIAVWLQYGDLLPVPCGQVAPHLCAEDVMTHALTHSHQKMIAKSIQLIQGQWIVTGELR